VHGQTFTLDNTGTLAIITCYLTRDAGDTGDLIFSILGTDASGVPDDTQTLFSGTVPATNLPTGAPGTGLFSLDVSGLNIPVTAGNTLTAALTRIEPDDVIWYGEDVDPATASTEHFPYSGAGPYFPLTADVNPTYSSIQDKAGFVSRDGVELLEVATGRTNLVRWPGSAPPMPATRGVDLALTPDGEMLAYPGDNGFILINLADETAILVRYADGMLPLLETPGGLQQGTDISFAPDGTEGLYPVPGGVQILDPHASSAEFRPWSDGTIIHEWGHGIDAIWSDDSRFGAYVRPENWEIYDSQTGTLTAFPYAGAGPGPTLLPDMDPVYNPTTDSFYYASEDVIEELDPISGNATAFPYASGNPAFARDRGNGVATRGTQNPFFIEMSFDENDPSDSRLRGGRIRFTTGIGREDSATVDEGVFFEGDVPLPNLGGIWKEDATQVDPDVEFRDPFFIEIDFSAEQDSPDPGDLTLVADRPQEGNHTRRYLGLGDDQKTVEYILDAELDAVTEVLVHDERQVGVNEVTSLDGLYVNNFIDGFEVRGQLVGAADNVPTPDGGTSGDFSSSGLSIVEPRSVGGTWGDDTGDSYVLDVLDTDTDRAVGRIHYKPEAIPVHDLSLYREDGHALLRGR